jgi:hypothetical protein
MEHNVSAFENNDFTGIFRITLYIKRWNVSGTKNFKDADLLNW